MFRLKSDYIDLDEAGEELGVPARRIIELIKEGVLTGYAWIQYYPPDHSTRDRVDKEKYSVVRLKSLTPIPGRDSLFCEHEPTVDAVEENFIPLEDLRFKSLDIELLKSENSTAAPICEGRAVPPPKNLLKPLVACAAWELQKDSGKFPQYGEVLNKLRRMAKAEDQAGAIIETIDSVTGISIVGGAKPTTIKTLKNWLTTIKNQGAG